MSSRIIKVKNKLEIVPGTFGKNVKVPGCEPLSSISSLAIAKNFTCKSSLISLDKALQLIPGSRVIIGVVTPAGAADVTGWYFELPSGPPPNGNSCKCAPDWYKILKDNAEVDTGEEPRDNGPCVGFNYTGCPTPKEFDYVPGMRHGYDPEMNNI